VPPDVHGYFLSGLPPVTVNGSFYWLLQTYRWEESFGFKSTPIISFSVGDEQFGWVHMPPGLPERVRHLAELDGSLCAVVHGFHHQRGCRDADRVIEILTWSGGATSSWSTRCRIELDSLPRPISEELDQEKLTIIPLCTTGGGKIILLATGRHKVFAYDAERNSVHKVFSMYDYVDFPVCHSDARLLINIFLHEERVTGVPKPPPPPKSAEQDGPRNFIKPGQTCLRCYLFGQYHCPNSPTHAAASSTSIGGLPGFRSAILHVTLGGDDMVRRREKHRSESYYSYFGTETWTEQTQWTPALRECLPTVMTLK
jgi:hypothetical protein